MLAHGFWKPCGLGKLFRVFSSFSSLLYIFSSLLGIFAIFGGILVIFGGKKGFLGLLEAF